MGFILGLSCFYHDSAAALINNGYLVAAAMEERFSRRKHDNRFPRLAIQFCLNQAGIKSGDLDYVVFYEKPLLKFERILVTALSTFPQSWSAWQDATTNWLSEKLWIKRTIQKEMGVREDHILFCEHHMSHAASAFFASPFREAAVLTIDGVGEWTATAMGKATSRWQKETEGINDINLFEEQKFPHSLGLLYSAFTAYLGFQVNDGEYKVMGMSPYGKPNYVNEVFKLFHQNEDGSYWLDMKYFSFHTSNRHSYNRHFIDLFGEPRQPDSDFFIASKSDSHQSDGSLMKENQRFADIAASIQWVTEDALIKIATHLYHQTKSPNLVIAGGVALNSKANYRLLSETPFDEIFIQPAAGDDGGALGAALWAYHIVLGQPRQWTMQHAYWGQEYTIDEFVSFLKTKNVRHEVFADVDELLDVVTEGLLSQKVIGWFQGRFEWGPRALGNRSIIADPRSEEMKEIVNARIKFREPFRPFAPVVLEESASEYFDCPEIEKHEPMRYMLMVVPVKESQQPRIPAVSHLGTARVQTIRRELNPHYYGLVERFGEATGVSVLLNTSFNLRGEPIVTSPEDAWNTFIRSDIDYLVLGSTLVKKEWLGG